MGTSKPPPGGRIRPIGGVAGFEAVRPAEITRNPGIALDLDWLREVRVDERAVDARAASLPSRRSGFGSHEEIAALLRAVRLLDLTTLSGDDTPDRVERLAAEARRPLPRSLLAALGEHEQGMHVAAVCVYHRFIETAARVLEGSGVPVAAVSAGFPHGLSPLETRVAEVEASVAAGAREIDAVIARMHVLTGNWQALHDEVRAFREASGQACLKVILATGELGTLDNVARASLVAMMAGADFVKTSTGKERVNATLPVGLTIASMLRAYAERTGYAVGLKAAGGIRTPEQALDWVALVREELGDAWLEPARFRIGASGLLAEIMRRLERHAGRPRPSGSDSTGP